MNFYPYKTGVGRKAQSLKPGDHATFLIPLQYVWEEPPALDVDYFVTSVDMKVGAYTLAQTEIPEGHSRNVTITVTAVDGDDTEGTVTVTGLNILGEEITEEIAPVADTTVQGVKAFASVSSIVGAGWVTNGGEDLITVGYGNKLGLPFCLSHNTVIRAFEAGVLEANAPTVAFDADDVEGNTVLLNTALDGDNAVVILLTS